MTHPQWYARPDDAGIILRKTPRLTSWNKSTDPDQVRLREYLEDTAELLTPVPDAPWTLSLNVGLPPGRDLLRTGDLDNYSFPLATHLRNEHLVSVWCTKRIADSSTAVLAAAREVTSPARAFTVRTTASAQTRTYKEQIYAAAVNEPQLPDGPIHLQLAFVVGPRRNWITLWKPTIDALCPLLGRTRPDLEWHPRDDRITELGLHVSLDPSFGHDVVISIAAKAPP
ncbi:hypothetical protein [Ornithinimicrobium cerasi]|uniref:hypothetical protein n=1 Tax=Ornithinimicrobium cerasi TaxID=2248773 RepID=UPI000F0001A1|nr:hypothetical protein [Ornithinimicrobium cerasi]